MYLNRQKTRSLRLNESILLNAFAIQQAVPPCIIPWSATIFRLCAKAFGPHFAIWLLCLLNYNVMLFGFVVGCCYSPDWLGWGGSGHGSSTLLWMCSTLSGIHQTWPLDFHFGLELHKFHSWFGPETILIIILFLVLTVCCSDILLFFPLNRFTIQTNMEVMSPSLLLIAHKWFILLTVNTTLLLTPTSIKVWLKKKLTA